MKQNTVCCGIVVAAVTLGTAFACAKDQDKEKTPTLSVGGADNSGGGGSDNGNVAGSAGDSGGDGGEAGTASSGGEAGTASNGGAGGGTTPTTGPDGCFRHPTTHLEIINACTDATKINKVTNLNAKGFDANGELLAPSALPAL